MPFKSDLAAQDQGYPFAGLFCKRAPAFVANCGRSPYVSLKSDFNYLNSKIRFHLFTELPLPSIGHKISVLTPIWSVQLVLGS